MAKLWHMETIFLYDEVAYHVNLSMKPIFLVRSAKPVAPLGALKNRSGTFFLMWHSFLKLLYLWVRSNCYIIK